MLYLLINKYKCNLANRIKYNGQSGLRKHYLLNPISQKQTASALTAWSSRQDKYLTSDSERNLATDIKRLIVTEITVIKYGDDLKRHTILRYIDLTK